MQLTDELKLQIRSYLGYPAKLYDSQNPLLVSTLQRDDFTQFEIDYLIANIANIETIREKISCYAIKVAGLENAQDQVKLFRGQVLSDLRSIGRQYVGELSNFIGVPIISDIFGSAGAQIPYWTSTYNQMSFGGGGHI